jgi:hypothetical protein
MLRFVTKKEYWDIEDSGIMNGLARPGNWHLKSIQDAVAYYYLHKLQGQHIAEVGGGNSRLLPALSVANTCYNIEPFEGVGGGPQTHQLSSNIIQIQLYLGKNSPDLPNDSMDAVFSVSVVEHVPTPELALFFQDNNAIMKKNGLCIHLIDIYCAETASESNMGRYREIKRTFFKYFKPLTQEIIDGSALRFHCSYATNPDNVMNSWNKAVPSLRNIRETQQSCSILLAGTADK